jgi:hypothetical protein
MSKKDIILQALINFRGDNACRARAAFRNCSEEEMNAEYGESGRTRREILNEYETHELLVDECIKEVNEKF